MHHGIYSEVPYADIVLKKNTVHDQGFGGGAKPRRKLSHNSNNSSLQGRSGDYWSVNVVEVGGNGAG